MPSCCYGDEYGKLFTSREASRTAARYRRRGLRGTARELVEGVGMTSLGDGLLLEVGGGLGEIQIALLEAGIVSRALNVDLSANWEEEAHHLLRDRNLADVVERKVGDFLDEADTLPNARIVVLHRVVCCYPDWRQMLEAAGARAADVVGITIPSDRWWTRAVLSLANLYMRLRGMSFRAFVHPPDAMIELMQSLGFSVVYDRQHPVWRTLVFQRAPA